MLDDHNAMCVDTVIVLPSPSGKIWHLITEFAELSQLKRLRITKRAVANDKLGKTPENCDTRTADGSRLAGAGLLGNGPDQ
jgi:hypothetical protein